MIAICTWSAKEGFRQPLRQQGQTRRTAPCDAFTHWCMARNRIQLQIFGCWDCVACHTQQAAVASGCGGRSSQGSERAQAVRRMQRLANTSPSLSKYITSLRPNQTNMSFHALPNRSR